MPTPRSSRRRAVAVGLLAAGALVAGMMPGSSATAAPAARTKIHQLTSTTLKDGRYIVILKAPGATSYSATRSTTGKFQARSASVQAYAKRLESGQSSLAKAVGAKVVSHYTLALNGFSADLTGKQAVALQMDRSVLSVVPDSVRHVDTWHTPKFLGLDGKDGQWNKEAGGWKHAGAGVVVGVLDTGIWPESASFAGTPLSSADTGPWDATINGQTTTMEKADGTEFVGACEAAETFELTDCNTKLISARYYPDDFLASVDPAHWSPTEEISPRDGDGHGSHTSSTAAGNHGVPATVEDVDFGKISGMAPAAAIAMYKICFDDDDPTTGGCYTGASLSAIDDAIRDGVDVINYSISGATDTVIDPVELAFEGAAQAGIFVAASAGNSGPTPSTVAHNSPWLTTVAASTHYSFENTLVLGDGTKIVGASISKSAVPSSPLVLSTAVAAPDGVDARLCGPDSLDPEQVTGKIVVCDRGVYARVDKSAEVARAGGVGMVLANTSPNSLDADFHTVPTIHISNTDGSVVKSYIASAGAAATAAFKLGNLTGVVTPVPQIAGFSSRGPALANDSDILKPDIAAPGVSVLAAVAPPSNSDRNFDLYSGTSMSSPHIAGLAAFIKGVNPDWTPMMIKSAMMTTATDLYNADGSVSRDVLANGAGNVNPRDFFDPGLFVTSDWRQWYSYLTGLGLDTGYPALAAKDVNMPSMAQGQVVGAVSFTRQFRAQKKGTWHVSAFVPGFKPSFNHKKLVFRRLRDLNKLTVTFSRKGAPLDQFAKGYVTLTGPTTVRLPVALRPVAVKAPAEVAGSGADGSVTVPITSGFTGDLQVDAKGLAPAISIPDTVAAGDAAFYGCYNVAPGTDYLRANLDSLDDSADLDLYLYSVDDACANLVAEVAHSATGSADESITVADPDPGNYVLIVDGFADGSDGDGSIDFVLDEYQLDATATLGSFHVTPNPVPVTAGASTSFDAVWSGLTSGRYLGTLEYAGSGSPTFVTVDVP